MREYDKLHEQQSELFSSVLRQITDLELNPPENRFSPENFKRFNQLRDDVVKLSNLNFKAGQQLIKDIWKVG